MWTTIIVQPIFNLLVLIYTIIPGHNFGLAVILFTVIIRLLLWPLVKKQLHQTRVMRELQPKIKQIKAKTKGNRQEESRLMMELYKERGVSPFGSIGVLLLQLPILFGLYQGLQKVVADPHQIVDFAYPVLQNMPWLQHLSDNIHLFDGSLFGLVDLTRSAVGGESFYLPAFILVALSAIVQYFQGQQLMPTNKDSKGLRAIMKDAGSGKQADSTELNAAVGKSTKYLIPGMVFIFTIGLASALSLYFLVSGLVAYAQQKYILDQDEEEMEQLANQPSPSKKSTKSTKSAKTASKPKPQTKPKPKTKTNKKTTTQSDIIEGEILAQKAKKASTKKSNSKAGKRKRKKK